MIRAQTILVGSVLIEPREVFLDMLHPIITRVLAELAGLDHLPLVCQILLQYSSRYLEPDSDEFAAMEESVGNAVKKVMDA